jgi:hypothetical protein
MNTVSAEPSGQGESKKPSRYCPMTSSLASIVCHTFFKGGRRSVTTSSRETFMPITRPSIRIREPGARPSRLSVVIDIRAPNIIQDRFCMWAESRLKSSKWANAISGVALRMALLS